MVESFAWMMWDSVILMSARGIYGVVLLRLIVGAFDSLRYRRVFLRVVLPQVSVVCILWGGLFWIDSKNIYIVYLLILGLMPSIIIAIFSSRESPFFILGTIVSHTIFLFVFVYVMDGPRLWHHIGEDWDNYKITRLFERAKGDVQVLQDASCYQLASVLTLAAEHRDTPENLLRYLAKIRGISPFLTAAESCPEAAIPNAEFLYTPFVTALRQHNVPIVRFFSQQLVGETSSARENRNIVARKENPLLTLYKSNYMSQYREQYRLEISHLLLNIMPELLNDAVYIYPIIQRNTELVAYFWQKHPPTIPLRRLEAMVLLAKTEPLMSEVTHNPEILITPPIERWDRENLLTFILSNGNLVMIQSLIDANVVDWKRAMEDGNNEPLHQAILRLRGGALENALLIQIIKAMQAQKALSNEQIAHYLPWTPTFPAAFLQAGLSCEQLREVLNASVAGGEQARNDTRQRLNALCPVAK
ncbi:hypothetical protein N4H07_000181 [Salmonella enterica]|nr:hypothetical protein [Salmonella enterica]